MKKPLFLDLDEVVEIHRNQIDRYGGHPGIRDIDLLKSAVAVPAAGFGDDYLHADIFEMAAAYLFHIISNRPFVDGNKRTGTAADLVFPLLPGKDADASEDSLEPIVRSAAEGKADKSRLLNFSDSTPGKPDLLLGIECGRCEAFFSCKSMKILAIIRIWGMA